MRPWEDLLAVYILSYLARSDGDMYQSKESERDVSESDGEGGPRVEGKEG